MDMGKRREKKKLDKKLLKLSSDITRNRDRRCRFCGSQTNLTSHHIIGRKWKALRYMPFAQITLCSYCHMEEKIEPKKFRGKVIKAIGEERYNELKEYKVKGKITLQEMKKIEKILKKKKERMKKYGGWVWGN